jgi:hypothetical protein
MRRREAIHTSGLQDACSENNSAQSDTRDRAEVKSRVDIHSAARVQRALRVRAPGQNFGPDRLVEPGSPQLVRCMLDPASRTPFSLLALDRLGAVELGSSRGFDAQDCSQPLRYLTRIQGRCTGSSDDDDVDIIVQHRTLRPKPFSNSTFHSIADNRVAHLATHRDSQALVTQTLVRPVSIPPTSLPLYGTAAAPGSEFRAGTLLRIPHAGVSSNQLVRNPSLRNPSLSNPSLRIRLLSHQPISDEIRKRVSRDQHHEVSRGETPAATTHTAKVLRVAKSTQSLQATRAATHCYFDATTTARRLRPFARRRLITRRPAWLFIRARNPCDRRLFVRLG